MRKYKYKVLYSLFTASYRQAEKCSFEYTDDTSSSFEDSISQLKSELNHYALRSIHSQWSHRVVITDIKVETDYPEEEFNYYFLHWRASNNFESLASEGYAFFRRTQDQADDALDVSKQTVWIRNSLLKQEVVNPSDDLEIIKLKRIA